MTDFVFEQGDKIQTGTHGDTEYVFAGGDPVPNTGGSDFVFESGVGIGGVGEFNITVRANGESVSRTAKMTLDYPLQWADAGDPNYTQVTVRDNLGVKNGEIIEDFSEGLSPYTQSGDPNNYSISDGALRCDITESSTSRQTRDDIQPWSTDTFLVNFEIPASNKDSYPARTYLQVSSESNKSDRVRVRFESPGTDTADSRDSVPGGVALQVNDTFQHIQFDPVANGTYTVEMEISET